MIHEVQVTFLRRNDKGDERLCKENYIVENKLTFTQVEERVCEEFESLYKDFDVVAIRRSKLREIVNERKDYDEKIFFATIVDTFVNEDGSEKEMKYVVALFAKSMQDAHQKVKDYMAQGLNDMELKQLKETKFLEVIR